MDKKEQAHPDKKEQAPVPRPVEDKNLTLAQKLKAKVNEALDSEKDLKPAAAERVNQIVNDAIAGMPLLPTTDAAPELTMAQKMKTQVDACVANGDISPELAAKLESLAADVEAAYAPQKA
jgi:hypothetical protein